MIAEPFIQTRSLKPDEIIIEWFDANRRMENPNLWQPYADFEREKLKELGAPKMHLFTWPNHPYAVWGDKKAKVNYFSDDVIGYSEPDYEQDSESGRLLKRAEFLKAVCEKEGVTWLPASGGVVTEPVRLPDRCCCFPHLRMEDVRPDFSLSGPQQHKIECTAALDGKTCRCNPVPIPEYGLVKRG